MIRSMWRTYDEMGDTYLAHAEASSYNALYDRPAVLAAAGDVAGLSVLDAGCGPGLYASELVHKGAVVTGFDASQEQLRLARERLGRDVALTRAVLGQAPAVR